METFGLEQQVVCVGMIENRNLDKIQHLLILRIVSIKEFSAKTHCSEKYIFNAIVTIPGLIRLMRI